MRLALGIGLSGRSAEGVWCVFALLLLVLIAAPAVSNEDRLPDRFDTVILDPGHGGEDRGALGRRGLTEKEIVLDVCRRLAGQLGAMGLRVEMTRDGDRFVPLEARTAIANDANGDLLISVHANSAASSRARGVETYFVSLHSSDEMASRVARRENESFGDKKSLAATRDPLLALLGDMMVTEYVQESSEFAKIVHAELSQLDPGHSRGVKQAPFVVLMGVQMPAALIEIGFLSNPLEEDALAAVETRKALATAMAKAVDLFGKRYDARRGASQEFSHVWAAD